MSRSIRAAVLVLVSLLATTLLADPPERVARLAYTGGAISMRPAGLDDWTDATINRVLVEGDELWSDSGSKAELHFGSSAIRIDEQTSLGFLRLDDHVTQLRLSQGVMTVRVRHLGDDDMFEIDAPNVSITVLRPGNYRVEVSANGDTSLITVREGSAEATASGDAFTINPNQTATIEGSGESMNDQVADAGGPDDFDRWSRDRDHRDDLAAANHHLSREVVGYEDLQDNGTWQQDAEYGWVWQPTTVAADWAPYHNGHWSWIEPWGWTWIDDARWGFAPFHYGRWAYARNSWFWVPGELSHPVYAPALVAWVGGGEHWGATAAFHGGGVAWFALAPREIYVPSYSVAPIYVNRINGGIAPIGGLGVNFNVTNVHYANRQVPGAVFAMPSEAFASARPVSQAGMRLSRDIALSAPISGRLAPIAPRHEALLGHPMMNEHVVRPPGTVLSRPVVAILAPPAPPVAFSARMHLLEQHPGEPLGHEQLRTLQSSHGPAPMFHPADKSGFVTPSSAAALRARAVDRGPAGHAQPGSVGDAQNTGHDFHEHHGTGVGNGQPANSNAVVGGAGAHSIGQPDGKPAMDENGRGTQGGTTTRDFRERHPGQHDPTASPQTGTGGDLTVHSPVYAAPKPPQQTTPPTATTTEGEFHGRRRGVSPGDTTTTQPPANSTNTSNGNRDVRDRHDGDAKSPAVDNGASNGAGHDHHDKSPSNSKDEKPKDEKKHDKPAPKEKEKKEKKND